MTVSTEWRSFVYNPNISGKETEFLDFTAI